MKKMLKKIFAALTVSVLCLSLAACGNSGSDTITVLSREEGSGTRSAFVELTGIEQDKVDRTTPKAEINSSTAVVTQTVVGNQNAIGYISLGSLDDSVKALTIDGVAPGVETVGNGSYPISRPFNVATKGELSEAAQDFLNFILSDEGQAVITKNGYVSIGSTGSFVSTNPGGTVKVAGSSSVSPVMEKLAEAYMSANSAVEIKLQTSDSSNGMSSTAEGLCDIGMASRAVKDSEKEKGLTETTICMDGIAVIVNKENSINGLTLAQVCDIFTGTVTSWSALNQ
ncbi:MAG: substrate-binding domain-containing protein [Faecousia sp.]|nr:extracellular solute-binding protein [Bacillota bacterium]